MILLLLTLAILMFGPNTTYFTKKALIPLTILMLLTSGKCFVIKDCCVRVTSLGLVIVLLEYIDLLLCAYLLC